VSDAPHIDQARRELETLLRRKASEGGVVRDAAPRTSRMRVRSAWPAWLRPAIVTAVAAVLTVVAVTIFRGGGSDEPVLRGGSKTEWKLEAPHVTGLAIVFQWNAVPNADAYDVELYDDALNQVLHSASVATTRVTVDRAALANVPAGAELTWRVRALRKGDVIATSPPASLILH
jgi:hypothetical protein